MPLPRLFRTASFRLTALYLLLFTASSMVLGGVVYWTTRAALEQQLRARVETEALLLTDTYRASGLPRLLAEVKSRSHGPGALDYLVQDGQGRVLGGEITVTSSHLGWDRIATHEISDAGTDEADVLQTLAVRLDNDLVLVVGDDTRRITEAEEAIFRAFVGAVVLTVMLGVAGGTWLSHLFLHRVDAISRTAEAIIAGDLARRIPVRNTKDELDRLATTLNRMLDRIAALMESLRQVSNDIAHDLRTPLSRMGQRLEDARVNAHSVADYRRAVEDALAEADALLGTFSALLRIAQVEAGVQRSAFREVNLSAIATTVAEAFTPVAEDQGSALSAGIASDIAIQGDRELLTQMLVNLVENALRHTPQGSRVRLMLALHLPGNPASGPVLAVEDDGPGIPAAEREQVLRRFYRLEQSRTTPGSGLGLSLVAAIAELHDAHLVLADAVPGSGVPDALEARGLCASVVFPRGLGPSSTYAPVDPISAS